MSWPHIALALKEKRHELCLTGKAFNEHLAKHGLDVDLYKITSLNYLTIHNTSLEAIGDDIALLEGLQTLSLHSNRITSVVNKLEKLDKLRVLDLSQNSISCLSVDLNALEHLTTINVSNNQLETFPPVDKCVRLQVIDVSHNKLQQFPSLCHATLTVLSDVKLGNNLIEEIPTEIEQLSSLKSLDVSCNKVMVVPYNLMNCFKLKELNIKGNPIKDRRLLKLIDQCRTKQVLDYLKQHAPPQEAGKDGKKKAKGSIKPSGEQPHAEMQNEMDDYGIKLHVKYASIADDALKIVITNEVKAVRQNIVCCLLHGLQFTDATFRKFIQLQNKLHESLCDKRNVATIATHDAKVLAGNKLIYTAMKPTELLIRPLNASKPMSGAQLFDKLQQEAENLRREKKRNVYSGIHKYLYLLEGKSVYACLQRQDAVGGARPEVISFPPITNSDVSKVTTATESILLEVTSHANTPLTRRIADTVLQEICLLMGDSATLCVEQLRVVDGEGNMKSVYPSKTDLLDLSGVTIVRD